MLSGLLQKLPSFKGKQRLARFLLRSEISSGEPISVRGKHNCLYEIPNLHENIGFEILINGIYEHHTIDFIVSKIGSNKVILDIGANIGAISIPVSKLRPDLRIVGVEASPWVFDYLKKNTDINGCKNIVLMNKAISSEGGVSIDFYSPKEKYGKGSLGAVFTSVSVKVEAVTLQEIIEPYKSGEVDFIKIDVEGYEALAFRGGKDVLQLPDGPDILFEFVDWAENSAPMLKAGDAQLDLFNYGYKLFPFINGRLHAEIVEPITTGACLLFATKRLIVK